MSDDVIQVPAVEDAVAAAEVPQDPAQQQDEVALMQLQSTEALRSEVATLSESVRQLSVQSETDSTSSVVVVDDAQWAWAQGAVRALSSSLLVLVVFSALACGIAVWRILSDGWR